MGSTEKLLPASLGIRPLGVTLSSMHRDRPELEGQLTLAL
jgi:hypothetical protein